VWLREKDNGQLRSADIEKSVIKMENFFIHVGIHFFFLLYIHEFM